MQAVRPNRIIRFLGACNTLRYTSLLLNQSGVKVEDAALIATIGQPAQVVVAM